MSRTDLLADTFTIIRNALMAKKENVEVLYSRTTQAIIAILKKENYLDNFKLIEDKKQNRLRVYLKYTAGKSAIKNIRRISTPGRRSYVKKDKVPLVLRGKGIAILSTSQGILTDREAREKKLGGEVLGYIW